MNVWALRGMISGTLAEICVRPLYARLKSVVAIFTPLK